LSQPCDLTAEAVLDAARARTGLSDVGADHFRTRLAVWMQAGDDVAELAAVGRMNLFNEAVRLAANRLQVEDVITKASELLDIAIERPLIIAGLPRSGTTDLLQPMSADPRLRSLPH